MSSSTANNATSPVVPDTTRQSGDRTNPRSGDAAGNVDRPLGGGRLSGGIQQPAAGMPGGNSVGNTADDALDSILNRTATGAPRGSMLNPGGGTGLHNFQPAGAGRALGVRGSSSASEYEYTDRDGVFYDDSHATFDRSLKAIKEMGFNPAQNIVGSDSVEIKIQRVDVMPRAKAIALMKKLLEHLLGDDAKAIGFQVILKHFALNSASTRAPETTKYRIDGRDLSMSTVRAVLHNDQRRFFRAFADETAEIIRTDQKFAQDMATRYQCAPHEAFMYFDAADCVSNLSTVDRHKINNVKRSVLNMAAPFDNRPVQVSTSAMLAEGSVNDNTVNEL